MFKRGSAIRENDKRGSEAATRDSSMAEAAAAAPRYTQQISPVPQRRPPGLPGLSGRAGVDRQEDEPAEADSESDESSVPDRSDGSRSDNGADDEDEVLQGSSQWLLLQQWPSGTEATAGVKAFALGNGFSLRVNSKSKGGSSKAFECTSDGCPVSFQMRKLASGSWHVTKYISEHVNCTSHAVISALTVSRLAVVRTAITAKRDITNKELCAIVQASGAATKSYLCELAV